MTIARTTPIAFEAPKTYLVTTTGARTTIAPVTNGDVVEVRRLFAV
jgi:hypothetical protein